MQKLNLYLPLRISAGPRQIANASSRGRRCMVAELYRRSLRLTHIPHNINHRHPGRNNNNCCYPIDNLDGNIRRDNNPNSNDLLLCIDSMECTPSSHPRRACTCKYSKATGFTSEDTCEPCPVKPGASAAYCQTFLFQISLFPFHLSLRMSEFKIGKCLQSLSVCQEVRFIGSRA